jgi:hypothetical protein
MSDFLQDITKGNYLAHHGIKGQKWGERRYQNPDGSLTDEGRRRYGRSERSYRDENGKLTKVGKEKLKTTRSNLRGLEDKIAKSQYAYDKQSKIVNKNLKKMSKGKIVDDFAEQEYVRDKMKADLEKDLSNYKKYADYALSTFGNKKIKNMKDGKHARIKDQEIAIGGAVVGALQENPIMLVSFAMLPTMIKDSSYSNKKAKYVNEAKRVKEEEFRKRIAENERETKKEIAEFRKKHKDLDWVSDEDLIDYYMD